MPTRFERAVPWLLLSPFLIVFLLGVTWNASFEAQPANTDLASEGDDRIRELKVEVRDRMEEEHCIGSGGSGCASDTGFHRSGSAKPFYTSTDPTALSNPAATALGVNDGGRLWIDIQGPDGVLATADDNTLQFWDSGAAGFRRLALGGMRNVDITTAAPASGNLFRFNGTNWVGATPAVLTTFNRATLEADEAFANDAGVAVTVIGVPDHVGGADTNNYAEVTVPATPSGVTWDIHVWGHALLTHDSADGTSVGCEVEQDLNDADTFGTTRTVGTVSVVNNGTSRCDFHGVLRGATAGAAYAFRIALDGFANTEDYTVDDAAALPAAFEGTSEIIAEVRPRTLY